MENLGQIAQKVGKCDCQVSKCDLNVQYMTIFILAELLANII